MRTAHPVTDLALKLAGFTLPLHHCTHLSCISWLPERAVILYMLAIQSTIYEIYEKNGASPTNHCWCQKTRVIALSCGIKISAVYCLILSQSKRVTDGQNDKLTDGQNYRQLIPR